MLLHYRLTISFFSCSTQATMLFFFYFIFFFYFHCTNLASSLQIIRVNAWFFIFLFSFLCQRCEVGAVKIKKKTNKIDQLTCFFFWIYILHHVSPIVVYFSCLIKEQIKRIKKKHNTMTQTLVFCTIACFFIHWFVYSYCHSSSSSSSVFLHSSFMMRVVTDSTPFKCNTGWTNISPCVLRAWHDRRHERFPSLRTF